MSDPRTRLVTELERELRVANDMGARYDLVADAYAKIARHHPDESEREIAKHRAKEMRRWSAQQLAIVSKLRVRLVKLEARNG